MLMPRKVKHRKQQRGRLNGQAKGGTTITFGEDWIRVFPDKPVTAKPAETRMGSGKGNPELWVAVVKPGRIMFELGGVGEELARGALERAIQKLPISAKVVSRKHQVEEVQV
jgi:large subunit ribosomal protein L16